MQNTKFIILLAIIILCVSWLYLFTQSKKTQHSSQTLSSLPTNSPPTKAPLAQCSQDQLVATISAQGAAGNIYGNLELTNIGKTVCAITLGNTITATTSATNILIHYQQNLSPQPFVLAPSEKVYSQVHYPNGPQCQTGISPQPLAFIYKTDQTAVTFQLPSPQTGKLILQSCTSPAEKTTIDIWPLSKTPITQ